eukprot:scaffold267425_cov41-Prasinocladus_malaysianus.AAC.1
MASFFETCIAEGGLDNRLRNAADEMFADFCKVCRMLYDSLSSRPVSPIPPIMNELHQHQQHSNPEANVFVYLANECTGAKVRIRCRFGVSGWRHPDVQHRHQRERAAQLLARHRPDAILRANHQGALSSSQMSEYYEDMKARNVN